MRWGVGVVVVVVLSACSFGGEERKPAQPPAPVPLVAVACERELIELDEDVAVALDPLAAKQAEIRRERKRIAGPLRKLRSAIAKLKVAERRLRDFNDAHPEQYLPSDLYYYWAGLRDEYEAAYGAYRAVFKRFKPKRHAFKALVNEGNTLWKDVRRAARSYDEELDGCLGPHESIERVEGARIRALELFAADVGEAVAKRSMLVECDNADTWEVREDEAKGKVDLLGYVRAGSHVAHLAPSICYALHRARFLDWEPDLSCITESKEADVALCPPRVNELIRAAETLAHEAQHVAGEVSEKRAQCYGLQNAALVAQRFDVPPSVSDHLAWYAWHFPETPKSYRSPECKDGGRLDLDAGSISFP